MNLQEEFDKKFVWVNVGLSAAIHLRDEDGNAGGVATDDDMKAFIQSLLDQQKKELLERITLKEGWKPDPDDKRPVYENSAAHFWRGYNQAVFDLEEIKKQLSEEAEIP